MLEFLLIGVLVFKNLILDFKVELA